VCSTRTIHVGTISHKSARDSAGDVKSCYQNFNEQNELICGQLSPSLLWVRGDHDACYMLFIERATSKSLGSPWSMIDTLLAWFVLGFVTAWSWLITPRTAAALYLKAVCITRRRKGYAYIRHAHNIILILLDDVCSQLKHAPVLYALIADCLPS